MPVPNAWQSGGCSGLRPAREVDCHAGLRVVGRSHSNRMAVRRPGVSSDIHEGKVLRQALFLFIGVPAIAASLDIHAAQGRRFASACR
jgi:hypothetical protein